MLSKFAVSRLVIGICCILLLVGCNRGSKPSKCEKPREYHEQTSIPPLDVPEELDAPDPAKSIQIPDIPGREGAPPRKGPCLEDPPDYFDTSPV